MIEVKKKHKFLKRAALLLVGAVAVGLAASSTIQIIDYLKNKKEASVFGVPAIDESDKNEAYGDLTETNKITSAPADYSVSTADVSGIVDNAMPAIVSINCTKTVKQQDFWGFGYDYETPTSGSGIIIGQNSMEILIATNNHVVEDAKTVSITFNDDKKAEAVIKGTDSLYDLAVVAVNINELERSTIESIKVATLGDSDTVKNGDMVIAIGDALGYGQSVTVGYVGALERVVVVDGVTRTLLQTDAAINPGNSGGALLDARGAVIGINSVKYSDTDVEGLGYAIPISKAIPIINDLMNREVLTEEEAGYLGIKGKNIQIIDVMSLNKPVGVYVYTVYEDSPAAKAGLRVGDIIVGFNDRDITSMEELQVILGYTRAGTTVELKIQVLENGEYVEKKLNVILGNRK